MAVSIPTPPMQRRGVSLSCPYPGNAGHATSRRQFGTGCLARRAGRTAPGVLDCYSESNGSPQSLMIFQRVSYYRVSLPSTPPPC